jgi:hypothetical protein
MLSINGRVLTVGLQAQSVIGIVFGMVVFINAAKDAMTTLGTVERMWM